MIRQWVIEHFKSVNEKISLELAPLTVFAGANSSGKSTVIQSILLTMQTMQSQVHSRAVILNGHILRLGTFNDILSNLTNSSSISIGFELGPVFTQGLPYGFQRRYYPRYFHGEFESLQSIRCDFSFSATGKTDEKDASQLQPRLESCLLRVQISQEKKDIEEVIEIRRASKKIIDRLNDLKISPTHQAKLDVSGLEYEVVSKPSSTGYYRRFMGAVPRSGDIVGSSLQHFLPYRFVMVYDVVEEQSRRVLDVLFNPDQAGYYEPTPEDIPILSADFANSIVKILDDSIKALSSNDMLEKHKEQAIASLDALKSDFTLGTVRKACRTLPASIRRDFLRRIDDKKSDLRKMLKAGRPSDNNLAYVPLPGFSDGAADYLQSFFVNQVKYLGPLRDEPKPVYPLAGSVDPKDIGFKGENTAAVLEVHRNTQIQYIPCDVFVKPDSPLQSKQVPLLSAVLEWLEYMGVAHDLRTVDKGKLGHELKVATPGTNDLHDLIHVGVGVSQVLPILVQSLLSEPGSTLVFEQPELHLHPRVQTRLADFFVSMTMTGKQCIVETHSEYLINRLRYRSAITDGDNISKNVILYFVEKDRGRSNYRPIRINKYGVIEEWPRGFFDENEENAAETLKAGMQKKQKEKNARKA